MPKYILLPATGHPTDAPVFATALTVARLFVGHLAFLHVRPDVRREIATLAASDVGLGTGIDAMIAAIEQEADTREHASEHAWQSFCSDAGISVAEAPGTPNVSAEWLSEVGSLAAWLPSYGRSADVVVVGRKRDGDSLNMDVMEAVLMDAGRPLLIASDVAPEKLAETVAIAWKDTREAASGVAAALPFIRKAQRVVILTVEEGAETSERSHRRLLRALRWSNPNTSVQVFKRGDRQPVTVLLEAAVAAGATMLAMGGYGHARLREAVFGGFTRAVLEQAPLPVLMAR